MINPGADIQRLRVLHPVQQGQLPVRVRGGLRFVSVLQRLPGFESANYIIIWRKSVLERCEPVHNPPDMRPVDDPERGGEDAHKPGDARDLSEEQGPYRRNRAGFITY